MKSDKFTSDLSTEEMNIVDNLNNIKKNLENIDDIEDIEDIEDDDIDEMEIINDKKVKKIIYYEPEFDDIRNNPNYIWMKYDERIKKTLKIMAYWKSFDREELYQQAYLYFVELCKIYVPFYNGNFIPFDKFLFKNLIIKLRAYIQNYYLKYKREQPSEISERTVTEIDKNNIVDMENTIFAEQIYSLINERQAKILELTFKGYKQQEIGAELDISQSRVSVIKKRTIKKLQKLLKNK